MPNTARLGTPYPAGTDRVMDGDNAMQAMAESLENLDKAGVPYRIQAGQATIPAPPSVPNGNNVVVTFAAGRFSQAPVITVSVQSSGTAPTFGMVASPTNTGFTFISWQLQGTPISRQGNWTAVQILPGSGPG